MAEENITTNDSNSQDDVSLPEGASYILDEYDQDGNSIYRNFDDDLFDSYEDDELIDIADLADLIDEDDAADRMDDTIQELLRTSKEIKTTPPLPTTLIQDFGHWLASLENMIDKLQNDHYLKAFIAHAINEEKEALAILKTLNDMIPILRSQKNVTMERRVRKAISTMLENIQRMAA